MIDEDEDRIAAPPPHCSAAAAERVDDAWMRRQLCNMRPTVHELRVTLRRTAELPFFYRTSDRDTTEVDVHNGLTRRPSLEVAPTTSTGVLVVLNFLTFLKFQSCPDIVLKFKIVLKC